jgi:hypothetical protein
LALPVVRHRGEFAAASGFVAVVRAARTCVESNFGRPTPSTQPNSLVDFHTGEDLGLDEDRRFHEAHALAQLDGRAGEVFG